MSDCESLRKEAELRKVVEEMREECEKMQDDINNFTNSFEEEKARAVEPRLHIGPNVDVNALINGCPNNLKGLYLVIRDLSHETLQSIGKKLMLESITLLSSGRLDLTVFEPLKNLQSLNIQGRADVQGWQALEKMHSLHELCIDKVLLSDEAVEKISKAKELSNLSIECCCKITNISPLARLKSLECLNAGNCLSLKNIGSLGDLPGLRMLCLSHTSITDDGIKALGKSHSIAHLDLEGCKNITNILPLTNIQTLLFLNIGKCINVKFSGFTRFPLLEVLIMDSTSVTDEVVEQITVCGRLRELDLSSCIAVTDIRPLSRLKELEKLHLCKCTYLRHFPNFKDFPVLSHLFLVGTYLNSDLVQDISKSTSLRALDVRRSNIDDPEALAIANMDKLSELHLDQWPVPVEHLSGLSELRRLTVGGHNVTDKFLEKLSENDQFDTLDLDDCRQLSCAAPIGSISSLKDLRLSGCSLVKDITFIRDCTMLRRIVLDGRFVSDEMITNLGVSTTIAILELVRCRRLKHITALEGLKALEELTLAYCENIEDLASIGHLKGLHNLVLRCTNFASRDLEGISANDALDTLCIENYDVPISINKIVNMKVRNIRVTDCAELLFDSNGFPDISKKYIVLERSGVHKNDKEELDKKGVLIV